MNTTGRFSTHGRHSGKLGRLPWIKLNHRMITWTVLVTQHFYPPRMVQSSSSSSGSLWFPVVNPQKNMGTLHCLSLCWPLDPLLARILVTRGLYLGDMSSLWIDTSLRRCEKYVYTYTYIVYILHKNQKCMYCNDMWIYITTYIQDWFDMFVCALWTVLTLLNRSIAVPCQSLQRGNTQVWNHGTNPLINHRTLSF